MLIKELQLLSDGLWECAKNNIKFFSAIQSYIRKLAEFDFSELNEDGIRELTLYADKIEEFFFNYRHYLAAPKEAVGNDRTARRIYEIVKALSELSQDKLKLEIESTKPKTKLKSSGDGRIFIGHGRNNLWARVQIFLNDELKLKTLFFESESRTSESITNILNDFLDKSSFAIIVFTAEDETADGKIRARQNVIHEVGLFQGRIGFDKVIILKQEGIEEFTNIAGLQYIPFSNDNIEQTFYELQRKLKKFGLIK